MASEAGPPDMKAFNQKIMEEFRANGGKLSGPLASSRLLLLTTTGAKSGKLRTTVVGYRAHGGRYLMIASGNGSDMAPHWYRNLQARPIATVEVGSDRFQARARTADARERPELAKSVEYLEKEQAKTKRQIPIVVLERI